MATNPICTCRWELEEWKFEGRWRRVVVEKVRRNIWVARRKGIVKILVVGKIFVCCEGCN